MQQILVSSHAFPACLSSSFTLEAFKLTDYLRSKQVRLLWVDILKILAVFAVILLHVSAPFLIPYERSMEWWTGNIYDSFSRWCVPLFIMISGALVLPRAAEFSLRHYLVIRIRRIVIPLLVWSVIYFSYRVLVKGDDLVFSEFIPMMLSGPVFYHLWFIYMLITMYFFAPVISAFLNNTEEKFAWYLILLWLCWASILPVVHEPLNFETYFMTDMDEYSALKLSGYFLLGCLLRERFIYSKVMLLSLLLIFLTGGAFTAIGTYVMSRNTGDFHPFFYNYYSPTVVAMALPLFLLIKSIFNTRKEITENGTERIRMNSPRFLQTIGKSVFGIYLIHALLLEIFRDGRLGFVIDHTSAFGIVIPLMAGIPIFAACIFCFSLGIILFFRNIPILRHIIA
jgi:surface polysaccharide O-acyltransferase-like enzyme